MSDGPGLTAVIAQRIRDAIELVAYDTRLLWCAQRIAQLRNQGSKATIHTACKEVGGRMRIDVSVRRADGSLEYQAHFESKAASNAKE